jgi:uncharacterized protein YrrD
MDALINLFYHVIVCNTQKIRKGDNEMLFKKGVDVFSSDNEKIGTLDRVVMDPKTKEVTHIVVREGFLFTEDKVVPIDLIGSVTDERIALQGSKEHLDELPEYEETHYIPSSAAADDDMNTLYWNPPLAWSGYGRYPLYPESPYVRRTEKNIPEGTVALAEGAKVLSEDGEHVGNIETLITDPNEHVTHLVVSSGLLMKERKIIPAHWLGSVTEDEVNLSVESRLMERLPEYHPEA